MTSVEQLSVEQLPAGREQFPVAVLLRRKPSNNRWQPYSWQVRAVLINDQPEAKQGGTKVHSSSAGDDFLWRGLAVHLYKDEAESYYYNLLSPQPALYVILRNNEQGQPEPFKVSACFDEANAFMETEEDAHPVAMPAQLYQWVEHFVLKHYVPQQRRKRKRKNWKDGERDR